MRSGKASRYGLRTLALGYLLVLLALPFSAIVYYTFQDGVEPVLDALTDESFVAALKLTLVAVLIAVPANTVPASLARWRSSADLEAGPG